jgi:nitrate/nitrite transporter NarK
MSKFIRSGIVLNAVDVLFLTFHKFFISFCDEEIMASLIIFLERNLLNVSENHLSSIAGLFPKVSIRT